MSRRSSVVVLLLALVLAACQQKPAPEPERLSQPEQRSAIIAQRVERGKSSYAMTLDLAPDPPRSQQQSTFRFRITRDGKPVDGLAPLVSLIMPLHDHGKNEFMATSKGDGRYQAVGTFAMGGEWEVWVTPDASEKAQHVFNVMVEE